MTRRRTSSDAAEGDRSSDPSSPRRSGKRRLDGAALQLEKRGGPLLITARFVPGGRTAITLSSGLTRRPYGWFAKWIAAATLIWATYAAGLGYFAGNRFKDNHTMAFLVAFGAALGATALLEIARWFRERRNHSE